MVDATEVQEELRERAVARLKKKSEFRRHLFVYAVVNACIVAIWAITGATHFFWPAFPLLGWGIGLIFHGWDTYRNEEISEDRIRREIEHLRK